VVFDRNRDQLFTELAEFLSECYQIDDPELLKWNQLLCYDFRKSYPVTTSVTDQYIKEVLGVGDDQVVVTHWEKETLTEQEFHKVAYHYQRKNRYWKCIVKDLDPAKAIKRPTQTVQSTIIPVLQTNT